MDDPARTADVRALGVDETTFTHAGPRRRTRLVTGLIDLRSGRLLDVVDGRVGSGDGLALSAATPGGCRRSSVSP